MEFTDYSIKRLEPKKERFEVWESNEKGFGLRVSPTGRKSFVYMYRFQGKSRRITFGNYPIISIAKALVKLEGARQLLENGDDPGLVKQTAKEDLQNTPTIAGLAEEYLDKWAKVRKRSWKEDQRILYKDVVPVWGKRKARDIACRDVVLLLDRIMERGAPIQANRTLATIRKMFKFALSRAILDASPCWAVVAPAKENRRDRVLSEEEIRIFWERLNNARMERGTALVLMFQLISGQRKGEVAASEWENFDLKQGLWTIPSEKSKNSYSHRIPLTQLALSVLSEIRDLAGESRWLFPSRHNDHHITMTSIDHAVRNNLDHFGIEPFTPHDLRRTAATQMASAGVSRLIIKKILNHADNDVTSIYDRHSYEKEKLQAMKIWETKLQSILNDKKEEILSGSKIYRR